MTNQAIITFDWKNVDINKTRALSRSASAVIDAVDGFLDSTCTIDGFLDSTCTINTVNGDTYSVTLTVFIDITRSYSAPKDCANKAAILADICQRLRGAIYTEAMNYRNGDIREGMVTDMFVYRWDTENWWLYDEENMEDDIHE